MNRHGLAEGTAADLNAAQRVDLFRRAYADYYTPIHVDEASFAAMAGWCDLDFAASRVVEERGSPLGFALLGIRGTRGWIGGMGVVPEARGRGLGALLMRFVLEEAKRRGLGRVGLEVLVENAPARRIYDDLGFRPSRMLEVWSLEPRPDLAPAPEVEALDPALCLEAYDALHPARAPWQRERETLEHVRDSLRALGTRARGGIASWLLYRASPERLAIADLVSLPGERDDRLERMIAAMLAAHPGLGARLLNLPEDDPAAAALARLGGRVDHRQIEMSIAL